MKINKNVFLKILGCAAVLTFNNISYSSNINKYDNSMKQENNFLSPLQSEYDQIVHNFETLYNKCDKILHANAFIIDIWQLLTFSSPSKEGTSGKLKNYCDEYIEWCNLYPKYHKKMKKNQSNLLTEIVKSCKELKKFLEKFENLTANQKKDSTPQAKFEYYSQELLKMDKRILEVFEKDSNEQITLHGIIRSALKMNTVFRGDDPLYSFEVEIEEVLNNILKVNKEQHLFNDKQLAVVNELVKLCKNLDTDVKNFEI